MKSLDMNSSPVHLPALAPAVEQEVDIEQLPQHTRPSRIKVLELPEKQRKRAESTASRASVQLNDGRIRAALLSISKVRGESSIHAKRGDRTGWATLLVEKRQQRETMPVGTRENNPSRPPPRLAMSAPVMASSGLLRPVPASPVGNAWSGEHYWQPQFSESAPESPGWKDAGCAHSDTARREVYESVVAKVEASLRELKFDNAQSGEQMTDAEAEVAAAMTVLDDTNDLYMAENEFPVPREIISKTEEFAEGQKQALDQYPIRHLAHVHKSDFWLHVAQSPLQSTTNLNTVRNSLIKIEDRRKSAGLEPSELAYRLAYAVQILEEKVRKLKARDSYEDSSDDEKMEYGKFLKSIAEVLPITVEGASFNETRRDVSENGLERRRLRGKAPSTLDLEAWASKLKTLDEKGDPDKSPDEDLFL